MSWSVSAVGRAAAIAPKLADQFTRNKCSEPEETIKNSVAAALALALAAFPPNFTVKVSAAGSQSIPDAAQPERTNQLSVTLEPIWGFVD